jgi:hypothetical protein
MLKGKRWTEGAKAGDRKLLGRWVSRQGPAVWTRWGAGQRERNRAVGMESKRWVERALMP